MKGEQSTLGDASSTLSRSSFTQSTSHSAAPFNSSFPTAAKSSLPTGAPNATKPSTTAVTMAAPAFMSQSQHFRTAGLNVQPSYSISLSASSPFDRDAAMKPVGTPSQMASILIRRLPSDTTEDQLRLMVVFSKELVHVEVLSPEQSDDAGFRSALLKFKTPAGAQQAKEMLHGKSIAKDVEMIVDVLSGSPTSSRRYMSDMPPSATSSTSSSTSSSGPTSRQSSRFNGGFQSMEKISPPLGTIYGTSELSNPASNEHFHKIFSPQSPIGNHLTERGRMSSKNLINHDADEDDETRELLNNPLAFAVAEHGPPPSGRRATAPQLPINRMAGLSLNTNSPGPASVPQYVQSNVAPASGHGNTMSPTALNNSTHSANYQVSGPPFQRHNYPPVNPADQNPPCNTLYVGNLPIDTSEEELKAMFSKQRGYKRLCFRTKQNGPMCFVEFEDVSFATKALHELYGQPLHNSVKGGIRLSFSKNPLGVRSGQSSGQGGATPMAGLSNMMAGAGNSFSSVSGPPPGLPGPPGISRLAYGGATSSMTSGHSTPYSATTYSGSSGNVWNNSVYPGPLSAGGTPSPLPASSSGFPSYMMGK